MRNGYFFKNFVLKNIIENSRSWQKVVMSLAVIIVFVAVYMLILPAITLDEKTAADQGGIDVPAKQTEAVSDSSSKDGSSSKSASKDSSASDPDKGSSDDKASGKDDSKDSDRSDKNGKNSVDKADNGSSAKDSSSDSDDSADGNVSDANASDGKASEDPKDTTSKPITETAKLTYDGEGFAVSAVCSKATKLPQDTELQVKELKKTDKNYEIYYQRTLEAIQEKEDGAPDSKNEITDLSFVEFYDISFTSSGEKVEPAADVDVTVEFDDSDKDSTGNKIIRVNEKDNIRIVHFTKEDVANNIFETEIIADEDTDYKTKTVEKQAGGTSSAQTNTETTLTEASFSSDDFSTYALVEFERAENVDEDDKDAADDDQYAAGDDKGAADDDQSVAGDGKDAADDGQSAAGDGKDAANDDSVADANGKDADVDGGSNGDAENNVEGNADEDASDPSDPDKGESEAVEDPDGQTGPIDADEKTENDVKSGDDTSDITEDSEKADSSEDTQAKPSIGNYSSDPFLRDTTGAEPNASAGADTHAMTLPIFTGEELPMPAAELEGETAGASGETIRVTVEAGKGTFPVGTSVQVKELTEKNTGDKNGETLTYDEYVSGTEAALGMEEGSADHIRLFDIKILDKNGEKIQPAEGSTVDVKIELEDKDESGVSAADTKVVHFADGAEKGEIIESVTENSKDRSTVEFQADSFSVYSIVDAPEPVTIASTGWYAANSLDQIEELGKDGFYVNWNKYYLTGELIHNVSGNPDRDGLGATLTQYDSVPEDQAAKFYFIRQEGTDTFKIYVYGEGETKKYVQLTRVNGNNSRAGLTFVDDESEGTAFTLEKNGNRNNFYISAKLPGGTTEYWWNRNTNNQGGVGAFAAYNAKNNSNTAIVTLSYYVTAEDDPYDLDGKTFGIAYNDDSTKAAAMSATSKTVSNQNRLEGVDLLIRADVLNNSGNLLVAENSDIQEWTFVSAGEDKYYIKTTVEGTEKYLRINGGNVTLVDSQDDASKIQAKPGTGANSGKWHFTVNNYSLNFNGSAANGFNAANNSNNSTWLNLVERSTLTEDDFVEYSARKISASDDILSATEKDDNGDILKDEEGNPVYRSEKTKVVIYTRVWNETTSKYEFYAVDHDGSLVRVYDSGDMINWIGNKVNSALWEFTEYTEADGTPNHFYELENTAYAGTYLVPQSEGIISDQVVGINLNGRRDGFDYSSIVAWDDEAYAYSGLKVERDENGVLRVVTCPLDEADDFHFAVITPPVEETDPVTDVATVDNNEYGISIKMIDFNNKIVSYGSNKRDSVQTAYLGPSPWNQSHAYDAETGLLSTDLTGGYPTIMADTDHQGDSLSGLFNNMTPANHLFIQSVYNESGYFEYDSTQNFAHLNDDGNFTVYNQLGAIGTETGPTRTHGQFMPYNDISAENGYAHDAQGNVITNKTNIRGEELSDTDPRKGEPLYSIPQNDADYYYGMELSAVFTQTPDGVDDWGHDIIFEFTGDDDFWFYVDGELVLDLGGVHSALGGSVNFRTGEVNCNGKKTSLYEIFKSNYQARGLDPDDVDALFVTKTVNGQTVHVFNDYTTHEMKMFYMERGAGASNLKMRFNLASVKPGTVELSKKLKGVDNAENKLIQYPYQIWYQTVEYKTNEDGSYVIENGSRVVDHYNDAVLLSQPAANTNLTGKVYAAYKGTKTLIPYKDSMAIGGITYNNVFLLKAGETAVINFPENTYRYKIVECGVDTAVYEHVYINGDQSGNEIFGEPLDNTDGWDPDGGAETPPASTATYDGTTRSDFGVTYDSTESRPRVEYTNEVPPEVMRTLSLKKVLYDTNGKRLTDEQAAQIPSEFTFRLYLGNEFADQDNLRPADMYTYYVKGPDGKYCKWDKAVKGFVSLNVGTFEEFKALSETEQHAGTFTTSMYGSISKIPAGYTVEVRDLIVGTKYKVEERDREVPKGYTRRDSDGYVRTDLDPDVVYYTENGTYGQHPEAGNTITAEPISDTIATKTESPEIEIRNQKGWGLTAKKEWTDKDFMIHDPIYLAVYLNDGTGDPETLRLIDGSVRRLTNNETEVYWFFQDLKVNDEPYTFDKFIVREVILTGTPSVDTDTGVVTGYSGIEPVDEGDSISVRGKTFSGTQRTEDYTVNYQIGGSTGQNENIRTDTVTNSRPGIQIYKTDWSWDNYLSGAVFTLKDSEGHDVGDASYTSNNKGLVTTAYLNEGTFTLDEIKTPAGYIALDEPISITVTTTEPARHDLTVTAGSTVYYITLNGPADFYKVDQATGSSMARITVRNRTLEGLTVVKEGVDNDTRTLLSGVHFALYDQVKDSGGNVRPAYNPKSGYEDIVTDANGVLGEITMSLGAGTYYLREKAAPSGYKKLTDDLCFTIGEDGKVRINNNSYSSWLTNDTSVAGTVSYKISIENTPLGITLRKTDETGTALAGSTFALSRKNDSGSFVTVTGYGLGEGGLIDLTDKTKMTFTGLSSGIYKLTETNAPAGYIILTEDVYFKVSNGEVTLTNEDGDTQTYSGVSLLDDNTTIAVKNIPGTALPNSGGCGTTWIYLLGSLLIIGCGTILIARRRIRA